MKGKGIIIALCLMLVATIGINCRADVDTESVEYVVQAGDTLWSIAEEYAPKGMDKREYIYNLKKDNELKTSEIYTNMVLKIEREAK